MRYVRAAVVTAVAGVFAFGVAALPAAAATNTDATAAAATNTAATDSGAQPAHGRRVSVGFPKEEQKPEGRKPDSGSHSCTAHAVGTTRHVVLRHHARWF
jgi:hypothetical protein